MKILILLILLIISGCDLKKDDSYSYLTEKIFYPSKNILGFENIFNSNLSTQNDVEIFGVMHFPDNYDSAKKYPLVIASHGSYNWRSHHLKYLAAGWSLGGTATLFNAWLPLQNALNKSGASFSGYLMWYPGCLALPDLNSWDKDLMQIYIGEEDNWTPPQPCKDLVKQINAEGGNAFIELYPNSFHSFDGPKPLRLIPDAYSWANCELKLNAETKKVYDPNNKLLDFSDPKLRRQAYESCATKGEVMAGANPEYRNAAYEHLATLLPQID
jgi:hypothetical protein